MLFDDVALEGYKYWDSKIDGLYTTEVVNRLAAEGIPKEVSSSVEGFAIDVINSLFDFDSLDNLSGKEIINLIKEELSRIYIEDINAFVAENFAGNSVKDFIEVFESYESWTEFCADYFPYCAYIEIIDDEYVFYVE